MPGRLALIAPLLLALACEEKPPGRKLASGIAQELTAGAGAVAFIVDAAHPADRGVPDDLLSGELWLAALDGRARKIGAGVSTQSGSFTFAPEGGEIAFLAAWRFRAGEGELWTASAGAEPVQIAAAASAFAWSPVEPALAFVAPGRLGLRRGRESLSVPLEGLQALAWSPDGKRLAARASAAGGGRLWLVDAASGAKREVALGTSDFAFAPDGTLAALGPPAPKGGDRPLLLDGKEVARATAFAFSPDGGDLALLSTAKQPGEATGELYRLRRGGEPQLAGQRVSDWRFDASGDLLFLARYDLRARAGVLTLAPPVGTPREIASKVQSFMAQGPRVLYLVQAPQKGDFKIELWAAELRSATPPRKIDEGVYGWQVSRDGATLYYKARCAGGSRSCSLLRQPLLDAGPSTLLAANVAGFDLSADGSRLLVQQPHRGSTHAVDLAVIPATGVPPERLKLFAEEADPGSRFADAEGKRVLFATLTAGKAGVYLAEIP